MRPPVASPELDEDAVEAEIRQIGGELAAAFPAASRHPLRALDTRAMELASSDRELRAALFRFVDVVPACRSLDDLARHLTGFLGELPETKGPVAAALRISHSRPGRAALGAAAASGVRHMAHRFIVGETPDGALGVLAALWEHGVASSVDLLGEATVTQAEADRYAGRCAEALERLAIAARGWSARPLLEADGSRSTSQSTIRARGEISGVIRRVAGRAWRAATWPRSRGQRRSPGNVSVPGVGHRLVLR